MKIALKLLIALSFISFNAFAAGGSEGTHGKVHGDFYPQKPADKSFSTEPAPVELLEPKALSTVSGTQVTLKWSPSETATAYRVQVATDPNFKWLVLQENFAPETSFQVNGLQAGQKYFWRIYPLKTNNDPGHLAGFPTASSFVVQ